MNPTTSSPRNGTPTQAAPVSTDPVAVAFLRLRPVMRTTGLSRSTIYRLMAARQFPRPVRIARRAVAWRPHDIDRWSEARPDAAR